MRIALTGGIACGKSLVAKFLNDFGIETIDADDIVHELIPDPAERKRIAAEVFADEAKRKALEARIHPRVKRKIQAFQDFRRETEGGLVSRLKSKVLRIAIIPLLFETRWDADYDIICCVRSARETQVARLAAQMPVSEKAEKSHYVIENDGTAEELKFKVAEFVNWLKEK